MDEAFSLMLAPRPHRCLGARLEPLTIGHALLLQRLDSPFLSGQPVTATRLFEAVFVCCQHHDKALANMQRWWIPKLLWLWAWRHRKTNLQIESTKFLAYLDENFSVARVKKSRGSSSTAGAPWPVRVLVALMAELHWSEQTALNCPVIKANGLLAALAESRGEIKLWSKADHEFYQWARSQDEIKFGKG